MKLIVGLGNPGVAYRITRHNIGFRVVDRLAQIHSIPIQTKRFKALYGIGLIDSQEVALLKPLTYMNRSGEAVERAADSFHLKMSDVIVVHDDLDLPFGRIRFKKKGGDGGHQGVRSIIEKTGQNHFFRLKVGIGRPPQETNPAEYVLSPFDEYEQSQLEEVLSRAAESLKVMLLEGIEVAMNRFQRKTKSEKKSFHCI